MPTSDPGNPASPANPSHLGDLEPRPDDDDYDLLTFGEAGARLIEEIRRQRGRIESLLASGSESALVVDSAQKRLDLLLAAQVRNAKPTAEELSARGFFSPRA
jgi:hypothetical protein